MKYFGLLVMILFCLGNGAFAARFERIHLKQAPEVFVWNDTCNVYVLREGEAALLINLGDGSVLDHLGEIGVKRVEWVLFTDHHREQCQGAPRLQGTGVKVAAPELERELFEKPDTFRKMEVSLDDKYTVYGSSYVRPPIQPILLDRALKTNDLFTWRRHEFTCLDTRGNSPGALTYLLKQPAGTSAFSGDLVLDRARMHTWFDTEWDYGFALGLRALQESVTRLTATQPALLLPSHGRIIRNPQPQLGEFADKLSRLEKLYVRGYDPEKGSVAYQDRVSKPTVISNVWQVSPHLFKFKRTNFWPNFSLILADNGHAILSDCGLLDEGFLDTALEGMREHFGLKTIDAVIVSHMHGDHFLEAQHLREKWGTQIWALDNMVDKMEHPEWFDYSAPIQAYGKKQSNGSRLTGVRVDHSFKSGESFNWENHRFTVDWMPGQTEFALCLHGTIDGRKVAFTGDNIFGDPDNPNQTGHEAMVAHNSAILEAGYIYGAEYLKRLKPDLLMGGHSFVMDHPSAFIERYRKWSYQMRDAFRALSSEKDYRYWFDPFWVRAEPYRVNIKQGSSATLQLHVRNFNPRSQQHHIEVHTGLGLAAEPPVLDDKLAKSSHATFPIRLHARTDASPGVHLVAFDVTLDGQRFGERFDCIVNVVP
jgi:glyoxylase-like metal-dependent hydrolase (beta-lactamase superfamily II)